MKLRIVTTVAAAAVLAMGVAACQKKAAEPAAETNAMSTESNAMATAPADTNAMASNTEAATNTTESTDSMATDAAAEKK